MMRATPLEFHLQFFTESLFIIGIGYLAYRLKKIERHAQYVERYSMRDELTGLMNRKLFKDLAKKELSRLSRCGGSLGVLLVDIDHFKAINDTHGHCVGDVALQAVAEAMEQASRACDLVCRYGGEEFAILAPNTSSDEAAAFAERIRETIEQANGLPHGLRLTVSVGFTATREGRSLDDLLSVADLALYDAKHLGRNCCVGKEIDKPQAVYMS